MEWKIIHIAETDSTNRWLREHDGEADMVVVADYQTAGKGQGTNSWESERGKICCSPSCVILRTYRLIISSEYPWQSLWRSLRRLVSK